MTKISLAQKPAALVFSPERILSLSAARVAVIHPLLDRRAGFLRILPAIYWAAVFGLIDEIDYLLDNDTDTNKEGDFFANALQAAAENKAHGKELVALFFKRQGAKVKITWEVVEVAARNRNQGREIMALLCKRAVDKFVISDKLVTELARSFNQEAMVHLLDQWGDEVTVTAEVVKAAAENEFQGTEVLSPLLMQFLHTVRETLRTNSNSFEVFSPTFFRPMLNGRWVYARSR